MEVQLTMALRRRRMETTSARREQGNSNGQNAENSNRVKDDFLVAVEHDCSVNGSEIGSWADLDFDEGRVEEYEGRVNGRMNKYGGKGNKRIRKDNEDSLQVMKKSMRKCRGKVLRN